MQIIYSECNMSYMYLNKILFKPIIIVYVYFSLCTFCKNEVETIEHLFWECHRCEEFLYQLKQKFDVIDIYLLQ